MNRIYQGKVTNVEILDDKADQGKPLDLDVLWRHDELFQDAVNYYHVCLPARLAIGHRPLAIRRRRCGRRESVAPYLTPEIKEPGFEQVVVAALSGNLLAQFQVAA